jgi:hypothetical protein
VRLRFTLIALALTTCLSLPSFAGSRPACDASPKLTGPCFVVHAELRVSVSYYLVLLPVGTKQILAVTELDGESGVQLGPGYARELPTNLQKTLLPAKGTGWSLMGDYKVCPFAPDVRDKWRGVCIASANHLRWAVY